MYFTRNHCFYPTSIGGAILARHVIDLNINNNSNVTYTGNPSKATQTNTNDSEAIIRLANSVKENTQEMVKKIGDDFNKLITKSVKDTTGASNVVEDPRIEKAIRDIAQDLSKSASKIMTDSFNKSKGKPTNSPDLSASIEQKLQKSSQSAAQAVSKELSKIGVTIDTDALGATIGDVVKTTIPKSFDNSIREIYSAAAAIKALTRDMARLFASMMSMKGSSGNGALSESGAILSSAKQIVEDFKAVSSEVKRTKETLSKLNDERKDIKENFKAALSNVHKDAASVVKNTRTAAKDDPKAFTEQVLASINKMVGNSDSLKGTELARVLSGLEGKIEDISKVTEALKKIPDALRDRGNSKLEDVEKVLSALNDLSKSIGNIPKISNVTGNNTSKDDNPLDKLTKGISDLRQNVKLIVDDSEVKELTQKSIDIPVTLKPDYKDLRSETMNSLNKALLDASKKGIRPDVDPIIAELKVAIDERNIQAIRDQITNLMRFGSMDVSGIIKGIRNMALDIDAPRRSVSSNVTTNKMNTPAANKTVADRPLSHLSKSESAIKFAVQTKEREESQRSGIGSNALHNLPMYKSGVVSPSQAGSVTKMNTGVYITSEAAKIKADTEENVKRLSSSLYNLQRQIITSIDDELRKSRKDWSVVRSSKEDPTKAFKLSPGGKQWVADIADKKSLQVRTGDYKSDVDVLVSKYKSNLSESYASKLGSPSMMTNLLGQWLKSVSVATIRSNSGIDAVTKEKLVSIKESDKGTSVGEGMRKAINNAFGSSGNLLSVFKRTYADSAAEKRMRSAYNDDGKYTGKVIQSVAIPAANVSDTGGASFQTVHGAQRALPKFVKFQTGFEVLHGGLERRGKHDEAMGYSQRIKAVGVRPVGAQKQEAEQLSEEMLSTVSSVNSDYVKNIYRAAAKGKGAELEEATGGATKMKDYDKAVNRAIDSFSNISKEEQTFENFSKRMKDLNLTAYDVVRSLNKIKVLNVYDIMDEVLKGDMQKGSPIRDIISHPEQEGPIRDFEKAVREVEGLLPLVEGNRPRRGYHQENVVNLLARTGSFYGNKDKLSPDDQKRLIKDLNLEISDTLRLVEAVNGPGSLPAGIRKISSLGIPESQAGAVEEYRPGQKSGVSYLNTLKSTGLKMYSEDLSSMAPFQQFQQAGRNISNVTNAMTNLSGGAETPKLRSERERALLESGRYGNKGYGYNVTAELRNTAANFEDQIVISGKLADAMTTAVSGLVRPAPAGRIGDSITSYGANKNVSVSEIKEGHKLVDPADVTKASREFMKILDVPEEYSGRADKAIIEKVEKTIAMVRGESVEVQQAKLAETFMNHFGRKLTTRYGSKGVSITPTRQSNDLTSIMEQYGGKGIKIDPKATLGFQAAPKTMGAMASELFGKDVSDDLKKRLVESGNKFMIDIFQNDRVVSSDEAESTKKLYDEFASEWAKVFGSNVPEVSPTGISTIRETHKSKFGEKAGYDLKPIDVRISSYGAAKRGLQTEFMESIFSNIAGTGEGGVTTLKQLEQPDYDRMLKGGALASYSSSLGYKGAGKTAEELAPELYSMFGGKGDYNAALFGDDPKNKEKAILAKKAAALEAASTFYSTIIDEFGKKRSGLVGEKFVQIIEEPHLNPEWEEGQIESGVKGARLNVPAFSAYSSIFGEDSSFMKETRESLDANSKKHWEYLKAIQTTQDKDSEIYKHITSGLKTVDVKDIKSFDFSTGVHGNGEVIDENRNVIKNPRSFNDTIFDIEKYPSAFNMSIPTGMKNPDGSIQKEEMYIPGPLARNTYPDPLLAGEYGMDKISRSLSNVVNNANRVQSLMSSEDGALDSDKVIAKIKPITTSWVADAWDAIKEKSPDAEEKARTAMNKLLPALSDTVPSQKLIPTGGDTEIVFIKKFYDRQMEAVAAGKKSLANAYATTAGTANDLIIGKSGQGATPEQMAAPTALTRAKDSGKTTEIAGKLGIDVVSDEMERAMKALQKSKINYYNDIASAITGKTGSINELFLSRKIPSIMSKAVNAVVDKRQDLSKFRKRLEVIGNDYGEDFSPQIAQIGDVSNKHMNTLKSYESIGVPILKQDEVGIPEGQAAKIPVEYTKKYKIDKNGNASLQTPQKVQTDLARMLEYKKDLEKSNNRDSKMEDHINNDLAPYVESIRYPFTGSSSIAPFKPKLISPDKFMDKSGRSLANNALMVPGIPEGLEGLAPIVNSVQKRIDSLVEKREELQTADAPQDEINKLTSLIRLLNAAISDVIPKYTAQAQKLDFDGDQIEIHSARTLDSRKDIEKHFVRFHKADPSGDIRTQDVFMKRFLSEAADIKTTGPYVFGESQAAFEKKFPSGKGFDFMRSPFLDKKMDYLSTDQALDVLSGSKDIGSISNVIEEVLNDINRPTEEIMDVLSRIERPAKNKDSKGIVAEIESYYGDGKAGNSKVLSQIKSGVKGKLYEGKTGDTVEAQLFKIHTGTETEGMYRMHRMAESAASFGGGLLSEDRKSTPYFKERFPDLKVFGGKPEEEFHTMINEMVRFGIQKGMDVKHAGEKPVAGEMLDFLRKGPKGANELWKKTQDPSEKSYGDLRDFASDNEKAIRMRVGELSTSELSEEARSITIARGGDASGIDSASREELIKIIIEKVGFKGFLEEVSLLIRKEAIDGLVAQAEGWSVDKKRKPGIGMTPVGPNVRAWAEDTVNKQMTSGGIDMNNSISKAQMPLYGMRTYFSSPSEEVNKYKDKFGDIHVPERYVSALNTDEKAVSSRKYKQSIATAQNTRTELRAFAGNPHSGAYSDMIKSATEVLYDQQREIDKYAMQISSSGYDVDKAKETPLAGRVINSNSTNMPEFARSVLTMKQGMGKKVTELSDLVSVPGLSDSEKNEVEIDTSPEFASKKRESLMRDNENVISQGSKGRSAEDIEVEVQEYTKEMVEKAQALKQLDRVMTAVVAKKNEGMVLRELMPMKTPYNSYDEHATYKKNVIQDVRSRIDQEKERNKELLDFGGYNPAKMMTKSGDPDASSESLHVNGDSTMGTAPPFSGQFTGMPSSGDKVVPVHIVSADPSATINVRGLIAGGYTTGIAGPDVDRIDSRLIDNFNAGPRVADTISKISPKFGPGRSAAEFYTPSRLAGGGDSMSGEFFNEAQRMKEQLATLISNMTGFEEQSQAGKATTDWGTLLHAIVQKSYKGRDNIDIERYGEMEDPVGGVIGGTADLIEYDSPDKTKASKIIDIKSTTSKKIDSIREAKRISMSSDVNDVLINVDDKLKRQINDYISQLNTYLKMFGEDAEAQIRFYDKEEMGKDPEKYEALTVRFDPERYAKDMQQLHAAREQVHKSGASFISIKNKPISRPNIEDFPSDDELISAMESAKTLYNSNKSYGVRSKVINTLPREDDSMTQRINDNRLPNAEKIATKGMYDKLSAKDLDMYLLPPQPAEGNSLKDLFTNLKLLHEQAKVYQKLKGVDMNNLDRFPKPVAESIGNVSEKGPDYQAFIELTNKLKEMDPKKFSSKTSLDAWKAYRAAVGDWMIAGAKDAEKNMYELRDAGKVGESNDAYGTFEARVQKFQEFVRRGIGKKTDIYTDDKRFVYPNLAMRAGVYMNPEQIMKKVGEPLGEDEKLLSSFSSITKGVQKGEMPAPIDISRQLFGELSNMDSANVNILADAEKMRRIGPEIIKAWDFDVLSTRATRLREALQNVIKETGGELDPEQKKHLMGVVGYLKSMENIRPDDTTGVTPVPKFIDPKIQSAMHARNVQSVREYLRKPEEEGGLPKGSSFSYTAKSVGQAGQTIENTRYDFQKYGDEIQSSGDKIGKFSEKHVDLIGKMQDVGATFGNAIKRVVMWGAASNLVYSGISFLGKSVDEISKVETEIAELRMVMNPLETDFNKLSKSAVGFAKQYGQPVSNVLGSMKVFAQQGLTQAEVIDRTQTSTLASNVTTLNAKDATEALTAAMVVFREEGDKSLRFLDAWSEVEARHAIEAGHMANAIKKSAAAAKVAGFTFDQLNGIVAAIGSTTRQSGNEIGTSMRFISRRLFTEDGPKSLAKLPKPVATIDGTGENRSGFSILSDLAGQWKDLTEAQKLNIATSIGGTRQYNSLLVMMDQWDEVLRGVSNSTNSKGSSERRNVEIMKTYARQMEQTRAAATELKMEIGSIVLPVFKTGTQSLKYVLEAISAIPAPIKVASAGLLTLFATFAKGMPIIDGVAETLSKGATVFSGFGEDMSNQARIAKFEITGKKSGGDTDYSYLSTVSKKTDLFQGSKLSDFHSSLGKILFLAKEVGLAFNGMIGKGAVGVGSFGESVGEAAKSAGSFFSISGSMVSGDRKITPGNTYNALQGIASARGLGAEGVKTAFKSGPKAVGKLGLKALGFAGEIGGLATSVVGEVIDSSSEYVGSKGHKILKDFASQNTGLIGSIAPLAVTLAVLAPAMKAVYEGYQRMAGSAQDYEMSMVGSRQANEDQLKSINDLIQNYDKLANKVKDVKNVSDPKTKERRMELGTYEAPLVGLQKAQKDATLLSNQIADSNINLVVGYDKLGNAVLKSTSNFKSYIEEVKKLKELQGIDVEIDIMSKFLKDLTETGGTEKFKVAMKDLAESFPVIGELVSRNIKIGPAKALEMASGDLNKRINLKQKYPLSTAADADIKRLQEVLGKAREEYQSSYGSFQKVYNRVVSPKSLEGLSREKIVSILTSSDLKKAYELQIDIDPKFKLIKDPKETAIKKSSLFKGTSDKLIEEHRTSQIMGKEVLTALNPRLAGTLDINSEFTKANAETAGIKSRSDRKVHSGDIITFMDKVNPKGLSMEKNLSDEASIAGNQAIAKMKKNIDGTYEWVAEYFDSKTLKIEERSLTDLEPFVDGIFPLHKIQEDLSYRMDALNTFVAGASAGLVGITPKDFKKDFNLGERFFSETPTTTLLQGDFGYSPKKGYGKVAGAGNFSKDIQEFYFKPMEDLKQQTEQLDKLRLEGMESGDTTLNKSNYEAIDKLLSVLKNNQVVLQFRAVFVDLMKEFSEGDRILKQNIATMRNRVEVDKETSGFMRGVPKGIDDYQTGIRKFEDLTPRQSLLRGSGSARNAAIELKALNMASETQLSQMDSAARAKVNVRDISDLSKATGASLSPDKMKNSVEQVAVESDTASPFKQLSDINMKVADNTSATVDRLDSLLENQGDPETIGKVLSGISEKIKAGAYDKTSPSAINSNSIVIADTLEKVASIRNTAESSGNQEAVAAANKILDQLSAKLASTTGLESGSAYVRGDKGSYSSFQRLLSTDFTDKEFKQRAFSGIDQEQFMKKMGDAAPYKDRSLWFDDKGFSKSEASDRIKSLKSKDGDKPLISADTLSKVQAATAAASYMEKLGKNNMVKQFDDQISQLDFSIAEVRGSGKGEGAVRPLAIKQEALITERDKAQKSVDFYGTIQSLSMTGVAASELGMSLGLTEKQIKYLNVAAIGTYAAVVAASKAVGEDIPKSAQDFGKELKKVSGKVLETGEMPGVLDVAKLKYSGYKLQKDVDKRTKEVFGKTGEEIKGESASEMRNSVAKVAPQSTNSAYDNLLKKHKDELDDFEKTYSNMKGTPDYAKFYDRMKNMQKEELNSYRPESGVIGITAAGFGSPQSSNSPGDKPIDVPKPGDIPIGKLKDTFNKFKDQVYGKFKSETKSGSGPVEDAAGKVADSIKKKLDDSSRYGSNQPATNVDARKPFNSQIRTPYELKELIKDYRNSSPEASKYDDLYQKHQKEKADLVKKQGGYSPDSKEFIDMSNRQESERFEWERGLNKDSAKDIISKHPVSNVVGGEYSKVLKDNFSGDISSIGAKAERGAKATGGTGRIQQAVAMYGAVALTDYVGKKNVEKTALSTMESKMQSQQDAMIAAMEKYPEASEKVLKDMYAKKKEAEMDGLPSDTKTVAKSLVQNTDAEYRKVVNMISGYSNDIAKIHEETAAKIAKIQEELANKELIEADRRASYKTITDEKDRIVSAEINRKHSFKNAIQKGMSNYGGDFELPASESEMSSQQRVYSEQGKGGKRPYEASRDLTLNDMPETDREYKNDSLVRFTEAVNFKGVKKAMSRDLMGFGKAVKDSMLYYTSTALFPVLSLVAPKDPIGDWGKKYTVGKFMNDAYKYSDIDLRPEMNAYSDGQNVLESQRKNLTLLSGRKAEEENIIRNSTNPKDIEAAEKMHKKLTDTIKEQTKKTEEYEIKLSEFAQVYSYLDKFASSMYQLQDALKGISIQEAVDNLPNAMKYKDMTDRLMGGSHPDAVQSVTPEEERTGKRVGMDLLNLKSSKYSIEEAKLRDQLRTASGQQRYDIQQQIDDLPARRQRELASRDQQRYDESMKRSLSPYQEQLSSLEKVKGMGGLSPEIASQIDQYQAELDKALSTAYDVVPINDYRNNIVAHKDEMDEGTYNQELAKVDKFKSAGIESLYRNIDPWLKAGKLSEMPNGIKEALSVQAKESGEGLMLYANVADPITAKISETNEILRSIATKEFGMSLEDLGMEPNEQKLLDSPWAMNTGYGYKPQNEERRASGGFISGAGSKTSDSIPAMLSNGEFVIKADAVQRLGIPKLNYMNTTGKLPGFADGGIVDDPFEWLNSSAAKRYRIPSRKRNSDGSKVPGSGDAVPVAGARGAIELPKDLIRFAKGGVVSREELLKSANTGRGGAAWVDSNGVLHTLDELNSTMNTVKVGNEKRQSVSYYSKFDSELKSGDARWAGEDGVVHSLSELNSNRYSYKSNADNNVTSSETTTSAWAYDSMNRANSELRTSAQERGAVRRSNLPERTASYLSDSFMSIGAQYDTDSLRQALEQKKNFADGAGSRAARWERGRSAGRRELAGNYFQVNNERKKGIYKKGLVNDGIGSVDMDSRRQMTRLDNDNVAYQSFKDMREKAVDRSYSPMSNLASSKYSKSNDAANAQYVKEHAMRYGTGAYGQLPFYLDRVQKNINMSSRALQLGNLSEDQIMKLKQSMSRSKAVLDAYNAGENPLSEKFQVKAILAMKGGTLAADQKGRMNYKSKIIATKESPFYGGLAESLLMSDSLDKSGMKSSVSAITGATSSLPGMFNTSDGKYDATGELFNLLSGETRGSDLIEYAGYKVNSNKGKDYSEQDIENIIRKIMSSDLGRVSSGYNMANSHVQDDMDRIKDTINLSSRKGSNFFDSGSFLPDGYSTGGVVKNSQAEKLNRILNKSAEVMHNGGTVQSDGLVFAKAGETFTPKGFASGGLVEGSVGSMSMNSSAVRIDASDILNKLESIELKVEDKVLKVDQKSLNIEVPKIVVEKPDWQIGVEVPKDTVKISIDVSEAASRLKEAVSSALRTPVNIETKGTSGNAVGSDKLDRLSEAVSKVTDRLISVKNELEGKIKLVGSTNNETINIDRKIASAIDIKLNEVNRDLNDVRTSVGNISSTQRQKETYYQTKFDDLDYRLRNAMNITGIGRGI